MIIGKKHFKAMAEESGIDRQEALVIAALRWVGPMTRQKISELIDVGAGSVKGRCHELINAGKIECIGHELVKDRRKREILAVVPDLADEVDDV